VYCISVTVPHKLRSLIYILELVYPSLCIADWRTFMQRVYVRQLVAMVTQNCVMTTITRLQVSLYCSKQLWVANMMHDRMLLCRSQTSKQSFLSVYRVCCLCDYWRYFHVGLWSLLIFLLPLLKNKNEAYNITLLSMFPSMSSPQCLILYLVCVVSIKKWAVASTQKVIFYI
jgi:hypothetical protein